MRIVKICLVSIVGLSVLSGCGAVSFEEDMSAKSPSKTVQQPAIKTDKPSIATVTDIARGSVPEKPEVTRVIIALDKTASYSISREGSQLIVNVLGAQMKSSIKQLELKDPLIKSITAQQVGNSVKNIVELASQDVAYRPSTGSDPFRIFLDIWQIAPKTAAKQPSGDKASDAVPKPVQALEVSSSEPSAGSESQKTQELTVDVRAIPEKQPVQEVTLEEVQAQEVPAQLQWFSEKLSQVLQEREQLKQDLLDSEKNFAIKDSMVPVLERKIKEANVRIVELEEELIKAKSRTSLAEQNEQAMREEINRMLTQWEQAAGQPLMPDSQSGEIPKEQIQTRSEAILSKLSTFQQKNNAEIENLKSQGSALAGERNALQDQVKTCSTELAALRNTTSKLAAIEREMQVKEVEMARLRKAIGAAAQLVMGKPGEDVEPLPDIVTMPSEGLTDLSTREIPARIQSMEEPQASDETAMSLAKLIQQYQLAEQTANPEDYVLGPEDVLQIKVLNEENLDKMVTVSSDGFITYPLLGDLRVEGLTIAQVNAQITSLLARDFIVDPRVVIEVVKPRSKKVYIMGSVKQPGYHELSKDQKLLGTLLSAGGPLSFETEARVLRLPKGDMLETENIEAFSPIIVDLQKLFVEGDQTQNILLRDGDVLMVAAKTQTSSGAAEAGLGPQQYYVVGSVSNPGVYTYKPNDTVLDAILRAGGFTEFAARNSTKLVRDTNGKSRTYQVKMKDVMDKGEMDKNMPIMPGDMVIVPESFF